MNTHQLTTIFCQVDDFCNDIEKYTTAKLLPPPKPSHRGPKCCLSDSEIMTLLILFQSSGYRNFKAFYTQCLCYHWKKAFPNLPSYNRFVEIMRRVRTYFICTSARRKKDGNLLHRFKLLTCLPY